MKIKLTLGTIGMAGALFATSAVISCGSEINKDFGTIVKDAYSDSNIYNIKEGTIKMKSHPIFKLHTLEVGLLARQETVAQNNNGEWKNTDKNLKGSSSQAMIDIIKNFNATIGKEKGLIVHPTIIHNNKILKTRIASKNDSSIPSLIFGSRRGYENLKTFKSFNKDFRGVKGLKDSSQKSFELNKGFLNFATQDLVSIIDFKLVNGLIYSYNKYINKLAGTRLYDSKNNLVPYQDINEKEYKSFKYKDSNPLHFTSVKNTKYISKIFGDTQLTYERLNTDFSLWLKIAQNMNLFKKTKYAFGSDFGAETIYSYANILSGSSILKRGALDGVNNLTKSYDEIKSQIDSNSFKVKGRYYNTTEFENSNLFMDITKGYSLNYYLDNHNLKYIHTPGFTFSSYKGFYNINTFTSPHNELIQQQMISDFINFIYRGKFKKNTNIFNGAIGLKNDFENISPQTYYSLFSKSMPTTNNSMIQLSHITSHLKDFKLTSTSSEIFKILSRKSKAEITNPDDDFKSRNFMKVLKAEYKSGNL
ncbi:MAG: hypothetical protein KAG14_04880 [Mycoplasmataceae bacterium]|nr:hypothetical protein [Mycoplasmataceae bacterium]